MLGCDHQHEDCGEDERGGDPRSRKQGRVTRGVVEPLHRKWTALSRAQVGRLVSLGRCPRLALQFRFPSWSIFTQSPQSAQRRLARSPKGRLCALCGLCVKSSKMGLLLSPSRWTQGLRSPAAQGKNCQIESMKKQSRNSKERRPLAAPPQTSPFRLILRLENACLL